MTSLTGYGQEYEALVSKAVARRFAGMYPLPQMGYEIIVAIVPDPLWGFKDRLHLQNISGQFVLASTSRKRSEWPEIFKAEV